MTAGVPRTPPPCRRQPRPFRRAPARPWRRAPRRSLSRSTSTTSTVAETETITRPITDSSICEPQSARGSQFANHTLTLFANSREAPIPIQIIGHRADQSFDAFALVERFFTSDPYQTGSNDTTEINGNQVWIGTYPNGNGDARWELPDGSIAYLRSRGLDRAALETIVGGLSPRDPSATIPGFDFDTSATTAEFELLHEHLNTGLGGNVATLQCISPVTDFVYQISAIDADPIVEYAGVLDRSVPLEVGVRAGTVIVINGPPDPSAPTVADVGNADTDTWAALLVDSPASDALAGWPQSPRTVPSLADVPVLLPSAVISGQIAATRTEYADDPAEPHDYFQSWFRKGPGAVALSIETNIDQPPPEDGQSIEIPGWDRAFFVASMSAGYTHLWLAAASGSVSIWAHGLGRDEVATLASSLTRRDADVPGWDVGSLPEGLIPVHEGWALGTASRSIRSTGEVSSFEMSIVHGAPSTVTAPPWFEIATFDIIDVNGSTAVVWEADDRAAVAWSPGPDLTVLLGYIGPVETAIELARSIQPVSSSTWRASTTPAPAHDGCNSMFCSPRASVATDQSERLRVQPRVGPLAVDHQAGGQRADRIGTLRCVTVAAHRHHATGLDDLDVGQFGRRVGDQARLGQPGLSLQAGHETEQQAPQPVEVRLVRSPRIHSRRSPGDITMVVRCGRAQLHVDAAIGIVRRRHGVEVVVQVVVDDDRRQTGESLLLGEPTSASTTVSATTSMADVGTGRQARRHADPVGDHQLLGRERRPFRSAHVHPPAGTASMPVGLLAHHARAVLPSRWPTGPPASAADR